MKDLVSSRRVSIVVAIASLLILWAIIAVPGGPAWPGLVSLSVLVVLLGATANLVRRATTSASTYDVVRGVEGETAGSPLAVTARIPLPGRH